MAEFREINEMPIQILQQLISVLLVNQNEDKIEGQIGEYYLLKNGKYATVIFDDEKVSYIAHFVKDKIGNWFFVKTISVAPSLKVGITEEMVEIYGVLFEDSEESEETSGLQLEKNDEPISLRLSKDDE